MDEKNNFLTQREFSKMATFGWKFGKMICVLKLMAQKYQSRLRRTRKKRRASKFGAVGVAPKFTMTTQMIGLENVLETKCKLVLMPENSRRIVSPFYAVKKYQDVVSFADGYPFLLIGENSLNDLNKRLETPLPMNRFRPNFVVAGTEPFAEDNWKKIRVGSTVFHVVKPCARCVITTIDQETGVFGGKEPLKTLASFRLKRQKILFGQNLIAENLGDVIKIGDEIEVIETKN